MKSGSLFSSHQCISLTMSVHAFDLSRLYLLWPSSFLVIFCIILSCGLLFRFLMTIMPLIKVEFALFLVHAFSHIVLSSLTCFSLTLSFCHGLERFTSVAKAINCASDCFTRCHYLFLHPMLHSGSAIST